MKGKLLYFLVENKNVFIFHIQEHMFEIWVPVLLVILFHIRLNQLIKNLDNYHPYIFWCSTLNLN